MKKIKKTLTKEQREAQLALFLQTENDRLNAISKKSKLNIKSIMLNGVK